MKFAASARRAFTLIEMVVVLAIMGIALAIVAPAIVLPAKESGLASAVSLARNAALRRSEQVDLEVDSTRWLVYAVRSGTQPVLKGKLDSAMGGRISIHISPLGLCTVDGAGPEISLNPFTCEMSSAAASR